MKRIKKKLVAVILAITILGTGLIGSYTTVPAAEFSAGALAASETLEWITAALAGAGFTISIKELLKPRKSEIEKDLGKDIDWDNYDWGDMLDSPAAQDQIDELDKTINKLYGNASAKWKEMYEKSLSPTPTPESSPDQPQPSPPVTVAPIDPDKVTPPGWDTLRKASMKNGYLALGAATYWCLKEAVKGFWDNLMENTAPVSDLSGNPLSNNELIGRIHVVYNCLRYGEEDVVNDDYYIYSPYKTNTPSNFGFSCTSDDLSFYFVTGLLNNTNVYRSEPVGIYRYYNFSVSGDEYDDTWSSSSKTIGNVSGETYFHCNFNFYVPYFLNGTYHSPNIKPIDKNVLWVNPDLKKDHDKNKSPSIPATAPAPAIKIPSLNDLKDLQNRGNNANDDERPSIILDWLKNHYTNPSTDPNPNPDPDPNPDPNPDPKPTTAPKPDDENTDVNPDDYKADLRLVFPFCIPFDLVHLIQAFEAEPEAPVFEFPFDLELENPWTGKKILDYHHVFKLDMSDYEPVIRIFRIFEIIFFIIGLLMITRQQMIKG